MDSKYYCTCYENAKKRICEHVVAVRIENGTLTVNQDVKLRSIFLRKKAVRGRVPKTVSAWQKQPTHTITNLHESLSKRSHDNISNDLESVIESHSNGDHDIELQYDEESLVNVDSVSISNELDNIDEVLSHLEDIAPLPSLEDYNILVTASRRAVRVPKRYLE